jgi:hypothetical protein
MEQNPKVDQGQSDQGRDEYFVDIDRMVNEGLGGGIVTVHNGLIEATTTDTMDDAESLQQST